MPSALTQTIRSRGFALCVHAGLWLLLYLAVTHLNGKAPDQPQTSSYSAPAQTPIPAAQLENLFLAAQATKPPGFTNAFNPFYTRYFVPPTAPPPPAPTTRKIEVTYQGFFETTGSLRRAMVKLTEGFFTVRIGAPLATNLFVADATMQTLTLTNLSGQTNVLRLNTRQELEVPIK